MFCIFVSNCLKENVLLVGLISSMTANTHGKQFFNEYGAFINDTQQVVFKLHQGQNSVFTVSGLRRKLIRQLFCYFAVYNKSRWSP